MWLLGRRQQLGPFKDDVVFETGRILRIVSSLEVLKVLTCIEFLQTCTRAIASASSVYTALKHLVFVSTYVFCRRVMHLSVNFVRDNLSMHRRAHDICLKELFDSILAYHEQPSQVDMLGASPIDGHGRLHPCQALLLPAIIVKK